MNKKGGFVGAVSSLMLFMIVSFILVVISAVFIYMGSELQSEMHSNLDDLELENNETNVSQLIDTHIGAVNEAYYSLYWISVFLIVGMVMAIIMGAFITTIRPIYFVPYIFIVIIIIIVAVAISQGYDQIKETDPLNDTFDNFIGANYILNYLPLWMTVLGFLGGIIMTIRLVGQSQEKDFYGY